MRVNLSYCLYRVTQTPYSPLTISKPDSTSETLPLFASLEKLSPNSWTDEIYFLKKAFPIQLN
jgi:hypothetical protein